MPALVAMLSIWLATVGNIALWQTVWELPEVGGIRGSLFVLGFGTWVAAVLAALLSLLAWPKVFKPVAVFLLLSAAGATHFMKKYSVVIDSTMLLNVMQTDAKEVADLLSPSLFVTLLGVGVLPAWWLSRQTVRPVGWKRRVSGNVAMLLAAIALAAGVLFLMFQDFASVMRNHKQIRYLVNPLNSVYALVRISIDSAPRVQQPMVPIGEDASLGQAHAKGHAPPMLILVVGETARAANFGLGGYTRDTTPELARLRSEGQLSYFSNVRSCGTNTQASVPCMFSHQGKEAHESRTETYENLLDVLQRAGLAVVWIDNQSGCKGVCARVPNAITRDSKDPEFCAQGECFDEVMLGEMERQLADLPADAKARGVVVVLHQMGSHGPAYYKRSPAAFKAFQPECTSNALQDCSRDELVNTYDNSIRYTDHFLAKSVSWLKQQRAHSTALLYVSDHGESLGERNLYLHGLPYSIAPDEQKHVPMLTWLSPAMEQWRGLRAECLNRKADEALTHDNLFHSVLGLMDVRTNVYKPQMDVFGTCVTTQK